MKPNLHVSLEVLFQDRHNIPRLHELHVVRGWFCDQRLGWQQYRRLGLLRCGTFLGSWYGGLDCGRRSGLRFFDGVICRRTTCLTRGRLWWLWSIEGTVRGWRSITIGVRGRPTRGHWRFQFWPLGCLLRFCTWSYSRSRRNGARCWCGLRRRSLRRAVRRGITCLLRHRRTCRSGLRHRISWLRRWRPGRLFTS